MINWFARHQTAANLLMSTIVILVGWIFSPPRKFLESCRGLVE